MSAIMPKDWLRGSDSPSWGVRRCRRTETSTREPPGHLRSMSELNISSELATSKVGDLTADQLRSLLDASAEGGIRLAFAGKQVARQIARRVRPRMLKTVKRYGYGPADEAGRNLLIEGDNLQAMVTLYKYRGQIDLILTDPPYNTGKDFRYNDRWDDDPNDDGLGELVSVDDTARHTKWLMFTWPRLQMMKAMLKPSGVLAICIDHRELFRLGQMLDELFGEANRLAIINWQKTVATRSDNRHISTATEYVLVYAKDPDKARTGLLERDNRRYSNPDNDPAGDWREGNLTAATWSAKNNYGIQSPFTSEIHYPPGTRAWAHPKRNIQAWLEEWGVEYEERDIGDGRSRALMRSDPKAVTRAAERLKEGAWPFVWFGRDGQGTPRVKTYLADVKQGRVPTTWWADDDAEFEPIALDSVSWPHQESGRSSDGQAELSAIVGEGHGFETVKPLRLFQKIIHLWSPSDGHILDPFAGSGTTGHAVLSLNQLSATERRFTLIEQGRPETGDHYARTLTQDRLRRVSTGNWRSGRQEPLRSGFTYKRLSGQIDGDALLRMARSDLRDTVIFGHFNPSSRRETLEPIDDDSFQYLVAKNRDGEGFFLVWDGPDRNTDLTKEVYGTIVEEARRAEGVATGRYHVYARRWVYQRSKTTHFYQIPDYVLASFGLDIRSEPFTAEDLD